MAGGEFSFFIKRIFCGGDGHFKDKRSLFRVSVSVSYADLKKWAGGLTVIARLCSVWERVEVFELESGDCGGKKTVSRESTGFSSGGFHGRRLLGVVLGDAEEGTVYEAFGVEISRSGCLSGTRRMAILATVALCRCHYSTRYGYLIRSSSSPCLVQPYCPIA